MLRQPDLKDIAKTLGTTVRDFADVSGDTPQALNALKKNNPTKYEVNTLGISAKALNLDYDDLVLMAKIKDSVRR